MGGKARSNCVNTLLPIRKSHSGSKLHPVRSISTLSPAIKALSRDQHSGEIGWRDVQRLYTHRVGIQTGTHHAKQNSWSFTGSELYYKEPIEKA